MQLNALLPIRPSTGSHFALHPIQTSYLFLFPLVMAVAQSMTPSLNVHLVATPTNASIPHTFFPATPYAWKASPNFKGSQ